MTNRNALPDITQDSLPDNPRPLDWVGMEGVRVPLVLKDDTLGEQKVAAKVDVSVDLQDAQAKGVHMSRMHLSLMNLSSCPAISYGELKKMVEQLVSEQQGLSSAARILISFDLLIPRKSLLSNHDGWLNYPIKLQVVRKGKHTHCQLSFEIVYSSTCPCSAALARQLTANRFMDHFGKSKGEGEGDEKTISLDKGRKWINESENMTAIPHSQRSLAKISLIIDPSDGFPFARIIEQAEKALEIPVQSVVKREDEQEFARLNGENLMFCEDAARRLSQAFNDYASKGLHIRVCHLESLHPHNAVAEVRLGSLLD